MRESDTRQLFDWSECDETSVYGRPFSCFFSTEHVNTA